MSPWRMYFSSKRRKNANTKITQIIAISFDHDRAIIRNGASLFFLQLQIGNQIFRSILVEAMFLNQQQFCFRGFLVTDDSHQLSNGSSKIERAPGIFAMPE